MPEKKGWRVPFIYFNHATVRCSQHKYHRDYANKPGYRPQPCPFLNKGNSIEIKYNKFANKFIIIAKHTNVNFAERVGGILSIAYLQLQGKFKKLVKGFVTL